MVAKPLSRRSLVCASLLFAATLAGCAGDARAEGAGESSRRASSAIVGGTAEERYPAVGYLYGARDRETSPSSFCTGTLIAPNVVLTAAHCLTSTSDPVYGFAVGTYPSDRRFVAAVRTASPDFPYKKGKTWKADIGYMILEEPVVDVTPLPVGEARSGCTVESVGYGRVTSDAENERDPGGYTSERKSALGCLVTNPTEERDILVVRGQTGGVCPGDSGAPLIDRDRGAVLGVVSAGWNCARDAMAAYVATAAHGELVDEALAAGAAYLRDHPPTAHDVAAASTEEATAASAAGPAKRADKRARGGVDLPSSGCAIGGPSRPADVGWLGMLGVALLIGRARSRQRSG